MPDTEPTQQTSDQLVFETPPRPATGRGRVAVEAFVADAEAPAPAAIPAPPAPPTASDLRVASASSRGAPAWTFEAPAIPPRAVASPTIAVGPSLGIVGKHRMPAVVVVLSIITLGIYGIVWHARINREMRDFDTRMNVHVARSTWAVVVPWIAGVAASVLGLAIVFHTQLKIAAPLSLPVRWDSWALVAGIAVVGAIQLFFPPSLIATVMTLERARICQDRVGMDADVQLHPAASVIWLIVPALGPAIYAGRLQARLNGVWQHVAPAASSRHAA